MILAIIVTLIIICGLIFFIGGTVGILRFPDFYSRLHPAGKLDTAGLVVTVGALGLYVAIAQGEILTAVKIGLIFLFVFITSPTATHAIIDAGVRAGLKPWTKSSAPKD